MLCTTESEQPLPGGSHQDLNYRTVSGKLISVWESHPEKEALIFYDDEDTRKSLTNAQVQRLSERCSSLLRSNGVSKGDAVCNMLSNGIEREITNFGIILAGAVLVPGEGISEKGRHFWDPIHQANVKHIVVEPMDDSVGWQMLKSDVGDSYADIERFTSREIPQVQKVFKFRLEHRLKHVHNRNEIKSAFEILNSHEGQFVERVYSHDPVVIFISKCTLQKHYKMVLRTHAEICQIAHRVEDMFRITQDDIIYNDWPFSWLPCLPLGYFSTGCTMVKSTLIECTPPKVVRETWDLIEKEKCTMAALEPSMIQMLSSHCEDLDEPHWTLKVLSTTGFVRQSVMDAIGSVTESIAVCYSLIEAAIVSRLMVTKETAARYTEGCVGDLTNPVRTKFDSLNKDYSKATKIGEILLQGKLVCKEYFNDQSLTKVSYTDDGFLMTGDLGFYDEKRRLSVLGRKADAIIRGDTAIFPRDIEEKVNQCPGIWKVKVVSIKDDKGVIQMCACVVPRSDDSVTIDRVKEFCRYQLGGTYDDDDNPHMPTYVFFFEEFPMLKGKVNRRMLAYMASEIVHGNANFEY